MSAAQVGAPNLKRGAGTPPEYPSCDDVIRLGSSWYYDWDLKPPICEGLESVPMIWGSGLPTSAGGTSPWLMVWNEPNNPDQANISPKGAAKYYAIIESNFPDKKLVVGNTYDGYGGYTTGIQWFSSFLDAYTKANGHAPRIDGIGMHCYQWTAAECIATTKQFVQLAKQMGIQVWVTEFAFFQGWYGERTVEQVNQEMQSYLTYLKSEPVVARYAWWATRIAGTEKWANPPGWNSPLLDTNGNMTAYGSTYTR